MNKNNILLSNVHFMMFVYYYSILSDSICSIIMPYGVTAPSRLLFTAASKGRHYLRLTDEEIKPEIYQISKVEEILEILLSSFLILPKKGS